MDPATLKIATTALRKPLEELYEHATGKAKQQLNYLRAKERLRKLNKTVASVQKVKTLWKREKAVNLTSFYYPSRVRVDNTIKQIEFIDEIEKSASFVIQGTVGQGKSIFLRYLHIKELVREVRLPIFVELRRYRSETSIREFLSSEMELYGFPSDDATFKYLAESGKMVLLLDGFDEIDAESVSGATHELETLTRQYPNLQIVITSRPDSGIQQSAHFPFYHLAPLMAADHKPFLEKIGLSKKDAEKLTESIGTSPSEIRELLGTPLLMTLLVIVYNATQAIPPTISAFYNELFLTLLTRHDNTKPAFRRKRACSLSDHELKRAFEAFCYLACQSSILMFNEDKIAQVLETAKTLSGLTFNTNDFCRDITKVACLMQLEGFNYQFIHKSVAEFHAARYIASSNDEVARKFYFGVRGLPWRKWQQELTFLAEIDRYRYLKYFYVPTVEEALFEKIGENILSNSELDIPTDSVLSWMTQSRAIPPQKHVTGGEQQVSVATFGITSPGMHGWVAHRLQMRFIHEVIATLPKKPAPEVLESIPPTGIPIADLLEKLGAADSVAAMMKSVISEWRDNLQEAKAEVARQESAAAFIKP